MKIGIDARFVGPQGTGLGKYTEKLIENLSKIDSSNLYVIFLRKANWDYLKLPNNFKKVMVDIPWYSVREQLVLPQIFKREKLDLLHIPHFNVPIFYRGKVVVTIHDLIHNQFSQEAATTRNPLIFKIKRLAYKFIINQAVKRAVKIITPSNFTKQQILDKFRVDPTKITVTYEAAEEEYLRISNITFAKQNFARLYQISNILKKYKIKTPFIIYVGNAYPHKNLGKFLDAFKILTQNYELRTMSLIIVCSRDVFWERLKKQIADLKLENRVIMTGYIPAEELSAVFKLAKAYVFPSLSEGFGIPGLNAMAAGLPVICSNIPPLKEIYGDAALYFNPNDTFDIAQKVSKVLSDSKTRSFLVARGKEQVKKYSWQKMAKETLNIYKIERTEVDK